MGLVHHYVQPTMVLRESVLDPNLTNNLKSHLSQMLIDAPFMVCMGYWSRSTQQKHCWFPYIVHSGFRTNDFRNGEGCPKRIKWVCCFKVRHVSFLALDYVVLQQAWSTMSPIYVSSTNQIIAMEHPPLTSMIFPWKPSIHRGSHRGFHRGFLQFSSK